MRTSTLEHVLPNFVNVKPDLLFVVFSDVRHELADSVELLFAQSLILGPRKLSLLLLWGGAVCGA